MIQLRKNLDQGLDKDEEIEVLGHRMKKYRKRFGGERAEPSPIWRRDLHAAATFPLGVEDDRCQ